MNAQVDDILKSGVSLTNCDREPIHIPGSIQPHGALIGFDAAGIIRVISSNFHTVAGTSSLPVPGQALSQIFEAPDLRKIEAATERKALKQASPIKIGVRNEAGEVRPFDGILHRSGEITILELEPLGEADVSFLGFYAMVQEAVTRIQATTDTQDICEVAAEEVRRLTGFDRVMVYRFDADWHGEVVAEARRTELEPFLGLHYPASDIPVQARKLYESNWLRLICDVSYEPSPLIPPLGPDVENPLDLSHSVLRSVSPIHREYLRNMGVSASMSISLLRDGRELWGLFACHHYSPKIVPYEVRMACEFLGQTLSLIVSARERTAHSETRSRIEVTKAKLIERASTAERFVDALLDPPGELLALTGAEGAAILYGNAFHCSGMCPSEEEIRLLGNWIAERAATSPFSSEKLSAHYPRARAFAETASGVISIPLGSGKARDRIFWFRAERRRTVNWAGAPAKHEVCEGGELRLSPRGSFALWQETVRNSSLPWSSVELEAAESLVNAINRVILVRSDEVQQLNAELQKAAHAKDEFLAVVSHELRTPLNAILGWVQLLQNGVIGSDGLVEALATIKRNATAQQKLIDDLLDVSRIVSGKMRLAVEDVDPHAVVSSAIEAVRPAADAKGIRIQSVLDPDAGVIMGDAARLQQIIWNLLSNAVKFTQKEGRVYIIVKRLASSIVITVSDNGAGIDPAFLPLVFDRFKQADSQASRRHQGLGLGLAIVRHLVELHGGKVSVQSEGLGRGASFEIVLPIVPVHGKAAARNVITRERQKDCPPELAGLKVLLVDDEPDGAKMVEIALTACDATVRLATGAEEGLALFKKERPDVLISDIGMPQTDGYEFIGWIRALSEADGGKVPAVALTAFARTEDRTRALRAGFTAHIAKPIAHDELLAVVASVSGRNLPGERH